MAGKIHCLRCGGTGLLIDGSPCPECTSELNTLLSIDSLEEGVFEYEDIPKAYRGQVFDKSLLPIGTSQIYGNSLAKIEREFLKTDPEVTQVMVCSPPGYGKTHLAYSIYSRLKDMGRDAHLPLDLYEVKRIMVGRDDNLIKNTFECEYLIIKIPLDLPYNYGYTIATIADRRRTRGGKTLFLYNDSKEDLIDKDMTKSLKSILKGGEDSTIAVYSFNEKQIVDGRS